MTIKIESTYPYGDRLDIKLQIKGKSSITEFYSLISDKVDSTELAESKKSWRETIEKEYTEDKMKKKFKEAVFRLYPDLDLIDINLYEKKSSWGDSSYHATLSYYLKGDGSDIPFKEMEQEFKDDKVIHDELRIYEFKAYVYFNKNLNLTDIEIQPIPFMGHEFRKIPMKLERKDECYYNRDTEEDDTYKDLVLSNKELGIEGIRKDSEFYKNLMDQMYYILYDPWGRRDDELNKKWEEYIIK